MKKARLAIGLFALLIWCLPVLGGPDSFVAQGTRYYDFTELCRQYGITSQISGNRIQYLFRQKPLIETTFSSAKVRINGINFCIANLILSRGGKPYISATDWNSTVRVLLTPRQLTKNHRVGTIIIDPGHGGKDQGAAGKFSLEKHLTLKIARRTAQILRSVGYRVLLTRTTDRKVDLARRPQLAASNGGNLFVSIHINSAADHRVSGIETFCLAPPGQRSSNDGKGKGNTGKLAGNAFDANNLLLAATIHRQLIYRTKATDRGVKRARFAVLRDLTMPGILVELGFISNLDEERKLNTDAYIEKLALGIVNGIIEYQRTIQKR